MVYEAGGSMAYHKVSGDMIFSNLAPSLCPYTGVTGVIISWTGYIWDSSSPTEEWFQPGGASASPQTRYSTAGLGYCWWLSKTTPRYTYGTPYCRLQSGVWRVEFVLGFSWSTKILIIAEKSFGATPEGSYIVTVRNYDVYGWTTPIYNTIDNIEVVMV